MLALLGLAASSIQTYRAWPMIAADEQGLWVAVERREGNLNLASDPAAVKVRIVGPKGIEPSHIGAKITANNYYPGAALLSVDRSPAAGWRTATADVSGLPSASYPNGAIASIRYYLPASNTKAEDQGLRSRWVGRKVWILGSAAQAWDRTLVWDPRRPVKIVAIKRLSSKIANQCGNPVWNANGGYLGGSFLCANPLQITIATPKGAWLEHVQSNNANGTENNDVEKVRPTTVGIFTVADEWHLKRVTSNESPEILLAKQTPKVRKAFVARDIVNGMPRRLAALLLGDPEPSSPAAEVWKRKQWSWSGMTPFGYTVSFDSAGRVASGESYGQLP